MSGDLTRVIVRQSRFSLGRTVATPGAIAAMTEAEVMPTDLLERHASGDWGDLDAEDKRANDAGLKDGSQLLSAYTLPTGKKVWVISDPADHPTRRLVTKILLPEDY